MGERLTDIAKGSEIQGAWELKYSAGRGGYYGGYDPSLKIIGSRAYTAEELDSLGAKLLASKKRREEKERKDRAENLRKFNDLKIKLGINEGG